MRSTAAALALAAGLAAPALAQDAAVPFPDGAAPAGMSDAEFGARVRAYLLDNPEVLMEALQVLETRRQDERFESDRRLVADNADALFDDGFSRVFGNPDGDVTIVEFADYRCGYCKAAHPQVKELLETDGDIRLVLKEFPILGPESTLAARAAMAALELDPEAYDDFHDTLMAWRENIDERTVLELAARSGLDPEAVRVEMENPEIAERIRATYALARELEISGTPSFVIGGQVIRGFVQIDQMRELVAIARERAG